MRYPTGLVASPTERSGRFPARSPVLRTTLTPGGWIAEVRTGPAVWEISHYHVECITLEEVPRG